MTQNIGLYLIDNTTSSVVIITVKDASANKVTDAYVKIQRYYPDTNTYKTVQIVKTDFNGQANAYLVLYNVFYRFIIEKDGQVLKTTDPTTISTTTLEITIGSESPIEVFSYDGKIAYSCYYNTGTGNLVCTVSDTSNLMTSARLKVEKLGPVTTITVCDVSESSSAVTLGCNIGSDGGTYIYTLSAQLTYGVVPLLKSSIEVGQQLIYGTEGVLLAFIIVGAMAFMGLFSPSATIVLGIVGLIASYMMKLVIISLGSLVGIILVGIIVLVRMRE